MSAYYHWCQSNIMLIIYLLWCCCLKYCQKMAFMFIFTLLLNLSFCWIIIPWAKLLSLDYCHIRSLFLFTREGMICPFLLSELMTPCSRRMSSLTINSSIRGKEMLLPSNSGGPRENCSPAEVIETKSLKWKPPRKIAGIYGDWPEGYSLPDNK